VEKPPWTSSSEAGKTRVRNVAAEFCLQASFHARRVLLHAVNLQHGTGGFTSPPKEGVLRILKIQTATLYLTMVCNNVASCC
jgi:hypothetical protein